MNYWHYKVKYFSDLDNEEHDEEGIVCASDWTHCMEELLDNFGKDELESIELLEWIHDSACIGLADLKRALELRDKCDKLSGAKE